MTSSSMSLSLKESSPASAARPAAESIRKFAVAMSLVAALRLCVLCTGLLSVHLAPKGTEPLFNFAHPWLAFDARSYRELALHGYAADRKGTPYLDGTTFTLIAYFPAWPFVSRVLSLILPIDVAMVLLSNVCSIIGFGFLYAWARRLAGARAALICVLIAATFPGAVSFAAGMTEGPFFMLVTITLWLLESERFYSAAVLAGIATATRPTGLALAMIVPMYAWLRHGSVPLQKRVTTFAILSAIGLTGIVGYEAFLWHRYDSPTAYFEAQKHWNHLEERRLQAEAANHINRHSPDFFLESMTRPQVWNRGIAIATLIVILAGLLKPGAFPASRYCCH